MDSDQSTAEKLREARTLIEDPERWTQGAYARDAAGVPCGSTHERAVSWCAEGALSRFRNVYPAEDYLIRALPRAFKGDVGKYNDQRPHWRVLRLFDRAIAIAEKSAS